MKNLRNKKARKMMLTLSLVGILLGSVLFGSVAFSYVSNTVASVEDYCNDVINDTLEQM